MVHGIVSLWDRLTICGLQYHWALDNDSAELIWGSQRSRIDCPICKKSVRGANRNVKG